VLVYGQKQLVYLPQVRPNEQTIAVAMTSPIVIDANGNNRYDPVKDFIDVDVKLGFFASRLNSHALEKITLILAILALSWPHRGPPRS